VHLPVEGRDRDKEWREFSSDMHDSVIAEIESYLDDRFQGTTYEFYWKSSRGTWRGESEKNQVFYIDLQSRVQDIEWFFRMKEVWCDKARFNQEVIYVAIHPIWVL